MSKTHQSSSNHKSVRTFGPYKKSHHHRSKSDANGKTFAGTELPKLLSYLCFFCSFLPVFSCEEFTFIALVLGSVVFLER